MIVVVVLVGEVFEVSKLMFLAYKYSEILIDNSTIQTHNVTNEFYDDLLGFLSDGELINININGYPASGKSTVAMSIASFILKKGFGRKMGLVNVARDQEEFSSLMKNPELKDTVIVIDEWNEMEESGENSTIEKKVLNHFSDVQAQRKIHKIACSPRNRTDPNAILFLEVIKAKKPEQKTLCYVYVRIVKGGNELIQCVGCLIVNVKDVLKQGWYRDYIRRKFAKMELITKEGEFVPRRLKYADVILELESEMIELVKLGYNRRELIKTFIKMICAKHKISQSILGRYEMTDDAKSLIDLWTAYYRTQNKLEVLADSFNLKKLSENFYLVKKEGCEKALILVKEKIDQLRGKLLHQSELNKKYNAL